MEHKYIKLPKISEQKQRKTWYTASSIKHPAKAHLGMMNWILKKFVDPGAEMKVTEKLLKELDQKIKWCDCE